MQKNLKDQTDQSCIAGANESKSVKYPRDIGCISQARITEQQDANATSPVIADELKSIVNAACFKAM